MNPLSRFYVLVITLAIIQIGNTSQAGTLDQKINGVQVRLDTGRGIALESLGAGITSSGGRLFGVVVGDRRVYSDEVTVRNSEIAKSASSLLVPFDLPDGLGSGALLLSSGNQAGILDACLTLTSGVSDKWRVLFPLIEKLSVDGISPDKIEFFFPFQEGWLGRGEYDLSISYGFRGWLPILAAWNPNGSGIAVQSRDATFTYRSLRFRNASSDGKSKPYYPDSLEMPAAFPMDGSGLSMSVSPIGFNLDKGDTWKSATAAIQVYDGKELFKAPFKSYEKWARSTWWKHKQTPDWLRDSFLSFAVHEHVGNAGFVKGLRGDDKFICSEQAEKYNKTLGGHAFVELAGWYNNLGDYLFEPLWGGSKAMRQEIELCHKANTRVCLYMNGRSTWTTCRISREHAKEWGLMRSPGKLDDEWSGVENGVFIQCVGMCNQVKGWQDYLRDTVTRVLNESGADAVRLDTLAQADVCYNSNHPHPVDPLQGVMTYLETVRRGVDKVGPEKAMLAEFCGSDAAARYLDGALAQGHDIDTPLVSEMTAYGVSPFRFVFPDVKCIEWGNVPKDYHNTSRRMLFNGIGITVSDLNDAQLAEVTKFEKAMRSVGDILGSTNCEPLVPTLVSGLYANRFTLKDRQVFTFWNQSGSDVNGSVIKIG
ncbi:MAG: DUF6259 domain-containing protein, partial [Armatimonadota bacterium]